MNNCIKNIDINNVSSFLNLIHMDLNANNVSDIC